MQYVIMRRMGGYEWKLYFFSFIFIVNIITDVPIFPLSPTSTQLLHSSSFPLAIPTLLSVSMGHAYMFFG